MIYRAPLRYQRLGDTTTQIVGGTGQLAASTLATVQAASSAGLLTLAPTLAASIPVAGAVVAAGLVVFSLLHDSQAGRQKNETSRAAEKVEAAMVANLEAWNQSSKSRANQAAALKQFDDAWQALANFCGQESEGSAGQRCTSERGRGGKYDYFRAYRDPIASDPVAGLVDKAAEAAAAADPVGGIFGAASQSGPNWTNYALAAVAVLALAYVGNH